MTTHIPFESSDGYSRGRASAGDAHKVAAADVAGKEWRSNLWLGKEKKGTLAEIFVSIIIAIM